jgi:O-antigen polymerase
LTLFVFVSFHLFNLKIDSSNGRILIWNVSLKMISDFPMFGMGGGSFYGRYSEYQGNYFAGNIDLEGAILAGKPEYAMNDYIQFVVEYGFFGLLLFIFPFGLILYRFMFDRADCVGVNCAGLVSSILGILVSSLFSYSIQVLPILVCLYIFLSHYSANQKNGFTFSLYGYISLIKSAFCLLIVLILSNNINRLKSHISNLEAGNFCDMGDYDSAIKLYRSMGDDLINDENYILGYAKSLHKVGEFSLSNGIIKNGLIYSTDPNIYLIMAFNYQKMGIFDLAELRYIRSHNIIPNRLTPRFFLFKLYVEKKMFEKARLLFNSIERDGIKVRSKETDFMMNEIHRDMKEEVGSLH